MPTRGMLGLWLKQITGNNTLGACGDGGRVHENLHVKRRTRKHIGSCPTQEYIRIFTFHGCPLTY